MQIIAVWFSCGAASAVAAKKTIELYGKTHIVRVINNPIAEEEPDNLRFLKDVQKWLGVKIEFALNKKYPNHSCVEVWDNEKYMSGIYGASCTRALKKQARQQWESENKTDYLILGFTADEEKRHTRFIKTERANILPVLINAGITKRNCFEILKKAGIELPAIYKMGYPNANCIGCVKASSPTYWNHVRKVHPQVFEERAKQSRKIGAKLAEVKGEHIFLDELSPTAKGRPMKNMDFECGIFCEENILKPPHPSRQEGE